jgi:site-specific recombinase XerC
VTIHESLPWANYTKALDDLFILSAGRPLSRVLVMEHRAAIDALSPSTVNVRLSAVRKMVSDARKNGMLGAEEPANLTGVPNLPQKGTRLGNWLTGEQARELLAVPDRSTLKGKLDYVLLAMLVGCALRREELAVLDVDANQFCGKGGGCWPISMEKGAGCAPRLFRVG